MIRGKSIQSNFVWFWHFLLFKNVLFDGRMRSYLTWSTIVAANIDWMVRSNRSKRVEKHTYWILYETRRSRRCPSREQVTLTWIIVIIDGRRLSARIRIEKRTRCTTTTRQRWGWTAIDGLSRLFARWHRFLFIEIHCFDILCHTKKIFIGRERWHCLFSITISLMDMSILVMLVQWTPGSFVSEADGDFARI